MVGVDLFRLDGRKLRSFSVFCFFIHLGLCGVFVAERRLCLTAASGGHSLAAVREPLLQRLLLLGAWASVVVVHELSSCGSWALEHRLSSCGTQAELLCGRWHLPGSGIEPVSLALASEFFATEPPGKPYD